MSELKKRLLEEEEASKINLKRPRPPPTLTKLLRKRAAGIPYKLSLSILLTRLRHSSTILLDENCRDPKAIFTTDDCIWLASKSGLYQLGYQLNPCFQIWTRLNTILFQGLVNTIHCSSSPEEYTLLIGTSLGQLKKIVVPKKVELSPEEIQQLMSPTTIPADGPLLTRNDTIWSVAVDNKRNRILVGCEQQLCLLNHHLKHIQYKKTRSAVFVIQLSRYHSSALVGLRNGRILSCDLRDTKLNDRLLLTASSSVTRLIELDKNVLLSICLNGSIDIWDLKAPKKPIHSFKGHVNEASHGLAFDIDLKNKLLLVAGNDRRVRIWSFSESMPIWTSEVFNSLITSAKLSIDFSEKQPNWPLYPISKHLNPGVLVFTLEENVPAVKYYSIL
ncbi:unnamed protein product [Rhizopus stolonifer]